jgi:hypothetical protein
MRGLLITIELILVLAVVAFVLYWTVVGISRAWRRESRP